MKIVIPMSGSGNRFLQAGYRLPKPLIPVHGRPMIEYVISLFPGETDFVFVCRDEHLQSTNMAEVLLNLVPTAQIVPTEPAKLGPVHAVNQALDLINDDEPVIVNYCDFFMDWDYPDFKKTVEANGCDGNVVSYRGFHPHLRHAKNVYASSKVGPGNSLVEIREKHSFTVDKGQTPQSAGTYYFGSGALVKKYFPLMIAEGPALNGEFYVSLVYNLMVRDGLFVHVYDQVRHFCQWGTPEDLREYENWEKTFEALSREKSVL